MPRHFQAIDIQIADTHQGKQVKERRERYKAKEPTSSKKNKVYLCTWEAQEGTLTSVQVSPRLRQQVWA